MTHIKMISFSSEGSGCAGRIADRLNGALIEQYRMNEDPSLTASTLSRLVQQAMVDCDLIVFFSDIDTVERVISPYIANSGYDPAVLCLDVSRNTVVELLTSAKEAVQMTGVRITELFRASLII